MMQEKKISFHFEQENYLGYVEKEYENSYLVVVSDPTPDMKEKYTDRMIISKKNCEVTN